MRTFQIVVLVICGVFILGGIATFALSGRSQKASEAVANQPITLWGIMPSNVVATIVKDFNTEQGTQFRVEYTEFTKETFDQELTEALASSRGPDAILLSAESLLRNRDRLTPIPATLFPVEFFKSSFVEAGEVFLLPEGIFALPLYIDPLVLYWNRTLFNTYGIAQPPQFWDQLLAMVKTLTIVDQSRNITQTAIGLGEMRNINNAKEIIETLFMQTGNSIIRLTDARLKATLLEGSADGQYVSTESALRFFTEFANPIKPTYSWNRSLPLSRDMFLSNKLAMYLGFASELSELRIRNPNLNFDVTAVPQVRDSLSVVTAGKVIGVGILKQSTRKDSAFAVLSALASVQGAPLWELYTGLPSARRDYQSEDTNGIPLQKFRRFGLITKAFLDPNPDETSSVFNTMVENVTSGKMSESRAITTANEQLEQLIR